MADRGRPAIVVSDKMLQEVERLAGLGFTQKQIARLLDVSTSTLERWLKRDDVRSHYDKGRLAAQAVVVQNLFDLILQRDDPKASVVATIFWLKCQAGWKDNPEPEEQAASNVVLYLPDNGRGVKADVGTE